MFQQTGTSNYLDGGTKETTQCLFWCHACIGTHCPDMPAELPVATAAHHMPP
jgi:hypothetical protein